MARITDLGRALLAIAVVVAMTTAAWQQRAWQAAWESENHCAVVGYSNPGIYQTSPRRAQLGCDCGYFWR